MQKLISFAHLGVLVGVLFTAQLAFAQVEIDVSGSAGDTGEPATTVEDVALPVEMEVNAETNANVSVSKDEAARASIDAESAALSAEAVESADDLALYTTATMKRDTKIENVAATSGYVTVTYAQHARLLGILPGTIRATATVSSNGTVDIDYPWYRFLFKVYGTAGAEEQLAEHVALILAGTSSANFSASTNAQILDAIHMTLNTGGSAVASNGATADTAGPSTEAVDDFSATTSDESNIEVN